MKIIFFRILKKRSTGVFFVCTHTIFTQQRLQKKKKTNNKSCVTKQKKTKLCVRKSKKKIKIKKIKSIEVNTKNMRKIKKGL